MRVRLVVPNGTIVLAAYRADAVDSATLHERCMTGCEVIELDVHDHVPASVKDDVASDDWDDGVTPVQMVPDDIDTKPMRRVVVG